MHILVRTLAPELSSVFEHCLARATYYVNWPGDGAHLSSNFISKSGPPWANSDQESRLRQYYSTVPIRSDSSYVFSHRGTGSIIRQADIRTFAQGFASVNQGGDRRRRSATRYLLLLTERRKMDVKNRFLM